MTKKTIVILSYYYFPQITPRAFRAKELAAEFIKRGWNVILITPHGQYSNDQILELHKINSTPIKPDTSTSFLTPINQLIMKALRRLLPGGKDLIGALKIVRHGAKTRINADIVLSIGLPFSVHLATYILKSKKSIRATRFIADYGDPFSAMEARYKGCLYAKTIERHVLHSFDEITVPVNSAKEEFKHVTDLQKIYISPQGLDITQFKISHYKQHPQKVRFAYAGLFYDDIRNPSVLLDYMRTLDMDIELHIYTRTSHEATRQIINKFSAMRNIIIHEALPRDECIFELSKYDFLVNIENEITSQIPSKLIDYSITSRPIFSFKPSTFNHHDFDCFINRNYEKTISINPEQFSIVNIANNLIDKKNHVQ